MLNYSVNKLYLEDKLKPYKTGNVLATSKYRDTKDPCVVYEGNKLHIFGTAGSSITEQWEVMHATSDSLNGPWVEDIAKMHGVQGPQVCAPGVIYDEEDNSFHMFTQTACFEPHGSIEYLVSKDGGNNFYHVNTSLDSIPGTHEDGIYDPHPAIVNGKKYIVYSGFPRVGRGDLYLAESISGSWAGPWKRCGMILAHQQIDHHNQHDHHDYEWGLEGAQIIQLPNGLILMNAVCFLPEGTRGTRQRLFFAIAKDVMGPYKSMGLVMRPTDEGWESGENGHASAVLTGEELKLFYQARAQGAENNWRYGHMVFKVQKIEEVASLID